MNFLKKIHLILGLLIFSSFARGESLVNKNHTKAFQVFDQTGLYFCSDSVINSDNYVPSEESKWAIIKVGMNQSGIVNSLHLQIAVSESLFSENPLINERIDENRMFLQNIGYNADQITSKFEDLTGNQQSVVFEITKKPELFLTYPSSNNEQKNISLSNCYPYTSHKFRFANTIKSSFVNGYGLFFIR